MLRIAIINERARSSGQRLGTDGVIVGFVCGLAPALLVRISQSG